MSKKLAFISVFALAIILGSASAQAIEVKKAFCINSDPNRIYQQLVDYASYASKDASDYRLSLGVESVSLVKMVKSQARKRSGDSEIYDVWIVMQPAVTDQSAVYPRFLLECITSRKSDRGFSHRCVQQNQKQHFGLNAFTAVVEVQASGPGCKENQSRLDLAVSIDPNASEIAMIKREVLKDAGVLSGVLAPLFDVDSFMRRFFEHFYTGLIREMN